MGFPWLSRCLLIGSVLILAIPSCQKSDWTDSLGQFRTGLL
nr:MAG TPA: protein of unknown function (DUF4972) [Caudoviricetes sp.]DAK65406.1 MAG TPA: protein of unknown function (DUF4972) [Caudoviricetes sp.]DAP43007.1 MAG TPA: protein of unknown function (DUF4972) [Caudoviricetes sp.]